MKKGIMSCWSAVGDCKTGAPRSGPSWTQNFMYGLCPCRRMTGSCLFLRRRPKRPESDRNGVPAGA
jgi:hypothetical protein